MIVDAGFRSVACDQSTPIVSFVPRLQQSVGVSLPQVHVADGVRPADLEDSSQRVVGKGLYFLDGGVSCPPGLCSMQ